MDKTSHQAEIRASDILRRESVEADMAAIETELSGKVILVTGAAGSIGSELCRQILHFRPAKLLCLDRNETALFYLQAELGQDAAEYFLCDYTDSTCLSRIFERYHIQVILHAAAYKHVALAEAHARETLQNNVFGLMRFLDIAESSLCETFVLLSSDKAVHPVSVMGVTKRMGELLLASRPSASMRSVAVRFGNVFGSQGSIVPILQRQLLKREPLTLTHPEATRFFISVEEAVLLVLQASTIGAHRDVLVFDMGDPVRIVDLCRALIRRSGFSDSDVEVVFTGLRPGEKLHEQLFYDHETAVRTPHPKIRKTSAAPIHWDSLRMHLDRLRATMFDRSDFEVREQIRRIIGEAYSTPEPFERVPGPVAFLNARTL